MIVNHISEQIVKKGFCQVFIENEKESDQERPKHQAFEKKLEVLIQNLSKETTREEIEEFLKPIDGIVRIKVMKPWLSKSYSFKHSTSRAYVTFKTEALA